MQQSIDCLKSVFNKQDNIEKFFDRLTRYLDSLFILNEEFNINAFHTVLTTLGGEDFDQSLYYCLISYDDDEMIENLQALENDYLIDRTKDLIYIYGPRLESHFFNQAQSNSINSTAVGYRKMGGQYEICLEINNYAKQNILIFDHPNNILLLCIKLLKEVKEVAEYVEIDEKIKNRLNKQIHEI